MPELPQRGAPIIARVARIAYAFVVMNYAAVAGTLAALTRRKVWR